MLCLRQKTLLAVRVQSDKDMHEKIAEISDAHNRWLKVTSTDEVPEWLKTSPFPIPSYAQVASINRRPRHPFYGNELMFPATIFIYDFGYSQSIQEEETS